MTKTNEIKEEQRSQIFAEGREAAEMGRSPLVCPYIQDISDFRFVAWLDGFRSVSDEGCSNPDPR
ncbi:Rmf/CrpP family protein [Aliirhizobium cellulosilyticum]|uniref:Rmf/CrpP family protein n=1 Tax=Aliirhizobium cellulosilyticum TaxID=393664 RepID=UPI003741ED4D